MARCLVLVGANMAALHGRHRCRQQMYRAVGRLPNKSSLAAYQSRLSIGENEGNGAAIHLHCLLPLLPSVHSPTGLLQKYRLPLAAGERDEATDGFMPRILQVVLDAGRNANRVAR